MRETLIRGADHILTMNDRREELQGADILLREGAIAAVGYGLATSGAVLEAAGVSNILTKCLGSHNPHNMVKATLAGLKALRSAKKIAELRGKTVEEITA